MGKLHDTIEEFKKFIFRGNVVDMAIGVVVGGAFSTIVNSLVNDIIMPIVGAIIGPTTFTNYKLVLHPQVLDETGAVISEEAAIMYGNFIQSIVNFLIIAGCIFFAVKVMNGVTDKLREKQKKEQEEAAPPEPAGPTAEELLTEIRDLLKEKNV